MKSISILGSTGSIGTQALDVVRQFDFKIAALSANNNVELLCKQAIEFSPKIVAIGNRALEDDVKTRLFGKNIKVVSGEEGLIEAACANDAQIVLTAVVGASGILPTIEAIKAKKHIALANKETLVAAGYIVMPLAKEYGVDILPVDSEHSAIFQCLMASGEDAQLSRLILCASGGPFFGKKRDELSMVTVEDALNHPSWTMGSKITIDSATLMNKGFEVIEAHHLFDVDFDKIEVTVHRQSIIHSMVEFSDKAVIAQLGVPDMKIPIALALTYPKRRSLDGEALDFTKMSDLTFAKPDMDTFGCLALCYEAGRRGGVVPAVLNAANEIAVMKFLNKEISFLEIEKICEGAVQNCPDIKNASIEDILHFDKITRERLRGNI